MAWMARRQGEPWGQLCWNRIAAEDWACADGRFGEVQELYAAPLPAPAPADVAVAGGDSRGEWPKSVDELANIIRFVDGDNTAGAGALAERIFGVLALAASPPQMEKHREGS